MAVSEVEPTIPGSGGRTAGKNFWMAVEERELSTYSGSQLGSYHLGCPNGSLPLRTDLLILLLLDFLQRRHTSFLRKGKEKPGTEYHSAWNLLFLMLPMLNFKTYVMQPVNNTLTPLFLLLITSTLTTLKIAPITSRPVNLKGQD